MLQIAKEVVVRWGTTRDGTIQTECICWYQILQLPGCLRYHTNTQLGSPWKTTRYKNLTGGSWRSGTDGTKCPKHQAMWWQIQPPNRLPLKGLLELSNVMPIISVIVAMTVQPTSHNMTKPWPTIFCVVRESVTMQIMTLRLGDVACSCNTAICKPKPSLSTLAWWESGNVVIVQRKVHNGELALMNLHG